MNVIPTGRDITEIASLLVGVALVALLVSQAQGTARVIDSATTGFANLLRTVTLQGGFGGYQPGYYQ